MDRDTEITKVPDDLDYDIEYLLYRQQAGDYMLAPSEAFMLLNEADVELLESYFQIRDTPSLTTKNAQRDVLAHRREIEGSVPDIRDRAHAIVDQLERDEATEFSYLTLRKGVLEHMVEQPKAFRKLRRRQMQTLDKYFLIVPEQGETEEETVRAALAHSRAIEAQDPQLRHEVFTLLRRVSGFGDPAYRASPLSGRRRANNSRRRR